MMVARVSKLKDHCLIMLCQVLERTADRLELARGRGLDMIEKGSTRQHIAGCEPSACSRVGISDHLR